VARRSPEVVSVIPGVGAPGAWVTVRGAGFTAEGDVRQPGWKAVRVVSSGDIRVSVPAHGPQTVNLRVVTASGLSPVTRKDRYTITSPATAAASVLSSVSPRAGPPSGGGTRVTVTGSGFIDVKKVAFGTVTGTSLSVVSTSELPGHRADSAAGSSSTRVRRVPS
jgi:hypothetical protein